jgi:hypothetical protein
MLVDTTDSSIRSQGRLWHEVQPLQRWSRSRIRHE